jgi:hypothetical protein
MSKRRKSTPRTPNRFRERELARAGGERVEVDPGTGRITVIVGGKSDERVADNEVENWLSKQQGQHENQR